jgi:hypothetical protein
MADLLVLEALETGSYWTSRPKETVHSVHATHADRHLSSKQTNEQNENLGVKTERRKKVGRDRRKERKGLREERAVLDHQSECLALESRWDLSMGIGARDGLYV